MHRSPPYVVALAMLAVLLAASFGPAPVAADGWHNASLATASLDEWLKDVKQVVPDLEQKLGIATLKAGRGADDLRRLANQSKPAPAAEDQPSGLPAGGGKIKANFTAEERALLGRKANDCMEILAYMDPKNIYPAEFPTFQLNKIPDYRRAAKQLVVAMGPAGASAVVQRLRTDLMTNGGAISDITPTASYADDMVELLRTVAANGDLTLPEFESLQAACAGQKSPGAAALAEKVQTALTESMTLPSLIEWAEASQDPRQQQSILDKARQRIGSASQQELLTALQQKNLNPAFRTSIANEFSKSLPDASVADLLALREAGAGEKLDQKVAEELGQRNPTYSQVQRQVPQIWQYSRSADPAVADAARRQIVNAFQRAPVSHCLHYLAQGDAQLNEIIWSQLDARIQRADAQRRAGYTQVALAILQKQGEDVRRQAAALELLTRIKDLRTAGPIIDALPLLPRELWPPAGRALQILTGQDFGPKPGDGLAEVSVSVKKWRQWWRTNAPQ